jgi:hypothetical protein
MGPHPLKADMTFYAKIPVKVNSARENRFSRLPFSIHEHRVSVANKHIERYISDFSGRISWLRIDSSGNSITHRIQDVYEPWLALIKTSCIIRFEQLTA